MPSWIGGAGAGPSSPAGSAPDMGRTRRTVLLLFAILSAMASARAGEFGQSPDRVTLLIGGGWYTLDTSAALTLSDATVPNAGVTFEDFLGLPQTEWTWRIEGAWQFRDRHYLEFGWVDIDRRASSSAKSDFQWGDYTFLTGASLESRFRTDFPYAAYRYDFRQTDQVKIAGTFGISPLGVTASIVGTGEVIGPGGSVSGTFEDGASTRLPVPLVGLRVEVLMADAWVLEFSARAFILSLSDLDGVVGEQAARFRWNASRRAGFAFGVDRTSIEIRRYETKDYRARFDYSVVGLSGFLTLSF